MLSGAGQLKRTHPLPPLTADWISDMSSLCTAMPFMYGCSHWNECKVRNQKMNARGSNAASARLRVGRYNRRCCMRPGSSIMHFPKLLCYLHPSRSRCCPQ